MAALLVLAWLLRGPLGLQPFSISILLAAFSLGFIGRVLSTETGMGAARAVASLLWNLTAASVIVILLVWFLGWIASIQSDPFPTSISSRVPDLAIGAIATGLGMYAVQKFSPTQKRATPAQPAFVVAGGKGPAMEGTRLTVKHDTVGMPIKNEGRTIGCVILGDVSTSFKTPMGMVSASLPGPVTTVGIPFQGTTLSKDEVLKMTGKTPKQLIKESSSRTQNVEVGPIKARGCKGLQMKIGPLIFDWDDKDSPQEKWLVKGIGDSFITTDGSGASAKWNGSSLSLADGSMKLEVGADSFSYSPTEVRTASPLHSLQVTQDKITLDSRKFTLKVSGDNVVFRTEDKTSTTESKALANDLRTLLTETAKKQVSDVMEGTPIDLSEMFTTTEKVLAKHD
jgi:hypothetical protein